MTDDKPPLRWVTLARARLVSKREPGRARDLLMADGIPWHIACGLVLDWRRAHRRTPWRPTTTEWSFEP